MRTHALKIIITSIWGLNTEVPLPSKLTIARIIEIYFLYNDWAEKEKMILIQFSEGQMCSSVWCMGALSKYFIFCLTFVIVCWGHHSSSLTSNTTDLFQWAQCLQITKLNTVENILPMRMFVSSISIIFLLNILLISFLMNGSRLELRCWYKTWLFNDWFSFDESGELQVTDQWIIE